MLKCMPFLKSKDNPHEAINRKKIRLSSQNTTVWIKHVEEGFASTDIDTK